MGIERLAQQLIDNKNKPQQDADLVFGLVTSANPLKIKIENGLELSSSFLILTASVKELIIKGKGSSPEGPVHVDVEVFKKLQVGDKVIMLKVQKGQKYVVLDRG